MIQQLKVSIQTGQGKRARRFCPLAIALWLGFSPVPGNAAEQPTLTRSTYEALSAAQKLMEKQKYFSALKKLRELQTQVQGEDKAYAKAVILQTLGYLYTATEDYPKAIRALQKSLALNALPAKVTHDLHYMIAQIYTTTEQYAKGAKFLEAWFEKAKSPSAQAYVLLANAYYYLGRYAEVIPPIVTAIELAKKPPEAWYQLHLAACLELKRYPQAAKVLETLIGLAPEKEQYWKQLAAVYLQLDSRYRALAVQALAADMGHLEGKELIYLSNLYRSLEIPYRAAEVLQRGIRTGAIEASTEHWERIAYAWSVAREWEKAVDALQRAGELSQDGKFALHRAQLLIRHLRWDEAASALKQALRKGGLEDPGQARFLLGQVRYEQGRVAEAIQVLKLAQRSPEYGEQAAQWLNYIKATERRP